MNQGPQQAQTLNCSGRECACLAIERVLQTQSLTQFANAPRGHQIGKVVQSSKERQVLPAGEPRIESQIASGVVADLPAHSGRVADRVASGNLGAAARRDEQRSEDSQERGFAGAVGTQQGHSFALLRFERDSTKRGGGRPTKRLQIRVPAAKRGRKPFLKGIQNNGGIGHSGVYSVSATRKQCGSTAVTPRKCMTVRGIPR